MPFRDRFPYFQHSDTIYLDNAMTTQNPASVIDAVTTTLEKAANVHRGSYSMAEQRTEAFETARAQIASLINADPDSIILTSGATASLNLVVDGWTRQHIDDGNTILYCPDDHASATRPLEMLQKQMDDKRVTIELRAIDRDEQGRPTPESVMDQIDEQTRMIRLTHVHNVYGSITDIETISKQIPDDIAICLDASQSIGHRPVDVQTLGVDFVSFSGHKMFGPGGTGVLWVAPDRQDEFEPPYHGGGQQDDPFSRRIEAGTPAISSIIGLGAAASFIQEIGIETMSHHGEQLAEQLQTQLPSTGISYIENDRPTAGPTSFRIDTVPADDVGYALDKANIAVRTGSHCRSSDETSNSIRVSPHIYNTEKEIEQFCSIINDLAS